MKFLNYNYFIEKNLNEEDLSKKEALELFNLPLPILGKIANDIRREKCGELVTFVVGTNINFTNICISKCKFCAFYARDNGYVLDKEQILEKVDRAVKNGATQILMQGGMNPDLGIEWFEDLFRSVKERYPNVHIHSLSAPEIYFLSKREKVGIKEVIERLRNAGLDSIPGGGAEILVDRIRRVLSPRKVDSNGWLKVMEIAHKLGIKTTATMMFGHIETNEDIVDHLFKIRDLQSKTKGFTAFIPWTFQPKNTELYDLIKEQAPPLRYLQVLAISRIVLHNFRNIQTSWLTQGIDIALLGLFFGANDFGDLMLEENVIKATGKEFKPLEIERVVRAIKSTGRAVAQRDTYYRILRYL